MTAQSPQAQSPQLLLDLALPARHSYGEWVAHPASFETRELLAHWLTSGGRVWLTSDEVCGKSHLVRALCQEHPGLYYFEPKLLADAQSTVPLWMEGCLQAEAVIIDLPAETPERDLALALFHLIERFKELNKPLLVVWRLPAINELPPELSSRLRAMVRVDMATPTDDATLRAILHSVAASQQWGVGDAIIDLLLTRLPRRLDRLIGAMRTLELASLSGKRAVGLGWARQQIERMAGQAG